MTHGRKNIKLFGIRLIEFAVL